jgi:hypothetical protein
MNIRAFGIFTLCIALYPGAARAQFPTAAGSGPSVNVSLGSSYTSLGMTPSSQVGLNGVDTSGEADFLSRVGIKIDVGYARAWNVFGSGRHSDVLDYLGGPVLHLTRRKAFTAYVQGLVGGARVTGPVPLTGGGFGVGYANKLAYSAGLGVEYRLSGALAFRVGGDYLHTVFFSPSQTIQGQKDYRAVGSIVYYFRSGSGRYSRF